MCVQRWAEEVLKAGIVTEASSGKRNIPRGSPFWRKKFSSLIFLCVDIFMMYVDLFLKQCIFTFIFLQDNLYLQIWPTVYKN